MLNAHNTKISNSKTEISKRTDRIGIEMSQLTKIIRPVWDFIYLACGVHSESKKVVRGNH